MRIDLKENGSVYHYTSLEKLLRYILLQRSLRLGRLSNTFDPDEQREVALGLSGTVEGDNESNDLTIKLLDDFNAAGREVKGAFSRILCFTNSYDPADQSFTFHAQAHKGWAQRPIWAHFADRHRGVSLEFDKNLLKAVANEALRRHGPTAIGDVSYMRASRPHHRPFPVNTAGLVALNTAAAAREYTTTYFFGELFEKDQSWEYEQEFRIASTSPCSSELFVPVTDAVTRVIVGAGADSSSVDSIRLALKVAGWDHIPVERVVRDPSPMLVPLETLTNLRGEVATPLYVEPSTCQPILDYENHAGPSTTGAKPLSCPGAFIGDRIPKELTHNAAYYRAQIVADMNRDAAEDTLRAAAVGNKLAAMAALLASSEPQLYADDFPRDVSYLFPTQLVGITSLTSGVEAKVFLGVAEPQDKEHTIASWKVTSDNGKLRDEQTLSIPAHESDQLILDYQSSLIDWLNQVLADMRSI